MDSKIMISLATEVIPNPCIITLRMAAIYQLAGNSLASH